MSLATKQMQERWEHQRMLSQEEQARAEEDIDNDLDLFSRNGACFSA